MAFNNLNAVTIVRVSTKKQGDLDRFGMESQRQFIKSFVASHNLIVRRAIDYKDVSGDAVMFTPEMQELQAFLRTPEMRGGHLVAKELSRLLRPNYSDYPLLQVFVDQQISIHLPNYLLQLWTPEGRMLAGVLCAVDFNEAQRIRERCMGGREEARKLGYCAAGGRTVPTGVLWDAKSKTYSYDPAYAPKIAEAFHMVANGETNFAHIIRKLDLHLRPARGTPKLANPKSFRRLLENPLFIGERRWDKKCDLSVPKDKLMYVGKDNKIHRRNRPLIAREAHEVYVRTVITPGLVDRDTFEKVQMILRGKSDAVHQTHALHSDRPKFAYRGLLFCGYCGQPLYTVANGGYYRCRDYFTKRGGARQCPSSSMRRDKLEPVLDDLFCRQFPRGYFLGELLKKYVGSDERKRVAERRNQLTAEQQRLAQKRERVIEFALEGTISRVDRDRRLRDIDAKLEGNRQLLKETVPAQLPSYREWQELFNPVRPFLRQHFAGYNAALILRNFNNLPFIHDDLAAFFL